MARKGSAAPRLWITGPKTFNSVAITSFVVNILIYLDRFEYIKK